MNSSLFFSSIQTVFILIYNYLFVVFLVCVFYNCFGESGVKCEQYLLNHCAKKLAANEVNTNDRISKSLHKHGVNMRLLDVVASEVKDSDTRKSMVLDMIVRCLKRMIQGDWRRQRSGEGVAKVMISYMKYLLLDKSESKSKG